MALLRAFAFLAVVLVSAVSSPPTLDETREPPMKYRVEVDGKVFAMAEGESMKLDGTWIDPTIRIVADPHRQFSYGGVSFLYPRGFTFEADVDDADSRSWVLSGNDFTIMVFVLSGRITPEAYADSMADRFGDENCKLSPLPEDLLGKKIHGTRLDVKVVGHRLTVDVFALPSVEGTRLLVLQDSPEESGRASRESREAMAVLRQSMAID